MPRSKVRPKKAPVGQAPLQLLEPARPTSFGDAECWVRAHVEWFVWAIVLTGFCLRFQLAGESYFNGDETQIMFPPFQGGPIDVYKAGLVFPYGPINNILMYFMTFFGSSEQYFRMISILPGALMAYIGYRWAAHLFGPATGVATACILSFSPAMINISAEVRHYMMHTFWLVCALYCLERAFGEQSLKWMRWFGASLLLALLTMYMSIWATAAIGVYAILRILNRELPRRLVTEWAAIQVAAVAICVIAYATHLHRLRGIPAEIFARDGWLRASYYHPESQRLFNFLRTSTDALFEYLFANRTIGVWMMYVFAAGIVLILLAKAGVPKRRLSVVSFVLPLMATCAAAIVSLYPYGGSRHDAFLVVFVAVPVAVAISFIARQNTIAVLLAAMLLVPYWQSVGQMNYLEVAPQFKKLEQLKGALDYISKISPRPSVFVVNEEGSEMARYYLCHAKVEAPRILTPNMRTFRCGDYKFLRLKGWSIDQSLFPDGLADARRIVPAGFPDPVWLLSVSDRTRITGNESDGSGGQFGRLVVGRLSPAN